ncbi:MAG: UDP-N-acetylmuramoyl-L-alanyl-D-glutamate--2,6-diaminopimelate ligase [Phycisphaerae bacterium]|nr:UDP-N-acetylmuramoyl-L-alanyl-D-glutamate--2,6-diaminopimelate ligase [Phycisphaerae bacterium]
MRFSVLLAESGLQPRAFRSDVNVSDVTADSRRCAHGTCFVAVSGAHQDGHEYIPDALRAGAAAIVCENPAAVGRKCKAAVAVVDDTHEALGRLAQAMQGWPAQQLTNIAVTGTNGKSTVAHLIREILLRTGRKVGLLGTVAYETPLRIVPATMTTPDPILLAKLCTNMVADGATHMVMEVSSHALDQKRTAGINFAVGVFTNLTGDHLDYHGTMESYLASKKRLFSGLSTRAFAVVNRDDPNAEAIVEGTRARILWYGLSPLSDLQARIEKIDAEGTTFDLIWRQRAVKVRSPLIGRHNVFNGLAAAGACLSLGMKPEDVAAALQTIRNVPGRLQRVPTNGRFSVFVDYAHTDDALRNVLSALRPITAGRILVVFGCGGDRDTTKRPRMARVAQELADRIFITSDNPRSENPENIIDEVLAGLDDRGRAVCHIDVDRRRAIANAICQAREGDVVLIAGKGHETYQVIGEEKIHFDDVEVANECLQNVQSGTPER